MKILVIDDGVDNLASLKMMLSNFLKESIVATATRGMEGIALARTMQPDVVVLDIQMPEMDGVQVCQILKSGSDTKHIPIIFLTASNLDAASRVRALEAGGDAFVSKPIESIELIAQIRAMLRIKLAEDAMRAERDRLERVVELRTASLRKNEATFRAIADYTVNWEVWLSTEGRILWVNPAAEQITGYTPREIMNMPRFWSVLSGNQANESFEQFLPRALAGESGKNIELHCIRKDSTPFWLSLSWQTIFDTDGSSLGVRLSGLDVTQQRLLQEQVQKSQKMESVGRLAGGVAHDFNNMLQGILGYSELLMDRIPAELRDLKEDVEEIQLISKRAADLTRQLLLFGRKQISNPVVLDLNQHFLTLEKMLRRVLDVDAHLDIQLEPHLHPIFADPGQMEQVVVNLVLNARDASKKTTRVTIRVKTANVSLPVPAEGANPDAYAGDFVKLEVSDDGIGMSKETQQRIFEPFFTTKSADNGMGLGLSVVYGIIKQSRGWIDVESVLDVGTTFCIYLPALQPHMGAGAWPQHDRAVSQADLGGGAGAVVLVVEDEPMIRMLAVKMLQREGYVVLAAANEEAGWELYTQNHHHIRLVFSDIVLNEGNGVDLANRIRRVNTHIPIILCSGFSQDRVNEQTLVANHYAFLPKPYSRDNLLLTVRQALDQCGDGEYKE